MDVSRGESGAVLLHCVGGLVLSSVMRGSKAPGSKYLPVVKGEDLDSCSVGQQDQDLPPWDSRTRTAAAP